MDITINNLYFKYDENSNCINAYDAFTNSLISYIHVNNNNNHIMDKNTFESECQKWADIVSYNNTTTFYGADYNSWY